MKTILKLLLIFAISIDASAQKQYNVWYFGHNAGIDFNSGSPIAIDGPLNTSEGVAVQCDTAGTVLFSTDGSIVYDANNDTLATGLLGSVTSTQSALVVPFPGSTDKYYLFTAAALGWITGINYSVIDMTLNGGLGGMVSMNTQLLHPACEKITAVPMVGSNGIWVIVHTYPTDSFFVYPVTATGIGIPVITQIGPSVTNIYNSEGYLKSSPDGTRLAAARDDSPNDPIEIFDFDAATRIISNYIPIPSSGYAYGISFSPDNTKLYVAIDSSGGLNLEQYDLTQSNFQNNPYIILNGSSTYHEGLQLAPDGKIYCTQWNQNALGVINNPNIAGSGCNYVESAFTLTPGKKGLYGLPNCIESYLVKSHTGISAINAEESFKLYPVPASSELVVSFSTLGVKIITVTDISGRTIYTIHESTTASHSIDLSNYAEGVYFIKLVSSTGTTMMKKFVVVH